MNRVDPEQQSLAPTLLTIENLFWKVERESYRTWHARNAYHKADHLYNFCISAHALRDYYFKMGLDSPPPEDAKRRQHEEWNHVPVLVAVRDIANSAKHWKLRRPADTIGVQPGSDVSVDVYMSEDETMLDQVSIPAWVIEITPDTKYDTWSFLSEVMEYWRKFLDSKGVVIQEQPRSVYHGEDESASLGPPE